MDAIRFTTQGDYACSWCGYLIPTRKDVLQDWRSADVAGMFCSESHARAASNSASYVERYGFEKVGR